MATEIERKFLLKDDSWRDGREGLRIAQGYLSQDPLRTVRVRLAGAQGWITIKGLTTGISRTEFEYAIPAEEARELLDLCLPTVIDKTRYRVSHGRHVWEIDAFHGENDGLVVAEIELEDESEAVELPIWAGAEVSNDARYFNANLASRPFCEWGKF